METRIDLIKKERESLGLQSFRSLPIDAVRAKIEITEDRIIKGYAIVWGSKNSFDEIVLKGACTNSLNARGVGTEKNSIMLLKHHKVDQPIGKPTVLREDDYGLYFEAPIVSTSLGNDTIEEIRSGVLKQLSYGFNYIWEQVEWREEDDALILKEIKLMEISLVTFSSDENAQLRSFEDYQQNRFAKDFTVAQLRAIANFANKEILNRDEHLEEKPDVRKSNDGKVTFF